MQNAGVDWQLSREAFCTATMAEDDVEENIVEENIVEENIEENSEAEEAKLQAWRGKLLRSCLRFPVLDNAGKLEYLPGSFTETQFHMDEGDMITGNPLRFLCSLTGDVCRHNPGSSEFVEQLLLELRALLEVMRWSKSTPIYASIWDLDLCISQSRSGWVERAYICDVPARLAGEALRQLGWSAGQPDFPCVELLDIYSYGAYSAGLPPGF